MSMQEGNGQGEEEVVVAGAGNPGAGEGGSQTAADAAAAAAENAGGNQAATETDDSSFDDTLSFFENGNSNSGAGGSSSQGGVTITEVQHQELMEKARNYDLMMSNPAASAVVKHFLAGGTVESLFSKYDTTDYTSLPTETLYRRKMQEDKANYGLTDDEVEEMVQEFLEKSPSQQKIEIAEYRRKLEAGRGKGLEELNSAIEAQQAQRMTDAQNFEKEFDNVLDTFVKKKQFFNVPFTQAEADKIKKILVENDGLPIIKNGKIDANEVFKMMSAYLFLPEIVKATRAKGEQAGLRKVLDEAHAIPGQVQAGQSGAQAASSPRGGNPEESLSNALKAKGWTPPTMKKK